MTKQTIPTLALSLAALAAVPFAQGALLADFDGNDIGFVVGTAEGFDPPGITPGGPTGSYFSLLNNVASQRPFISFDSDENDPADDYTGWTKATLTMDFRTASVQADGFGVNFLDTSVHGHTGGIGYLDQFGGQGVEERARIDNSFGVGFRTFQATNARITYDNQELGVDTPYTLPQNDTWASLSINVDRNAVTKEATVDVTIYDQAGQAGNAQNVFTDFAVQDFVIEDFRVQIGGRTGGSAMTLELDNIELDVTVPIPGDSDGDGMTDEWEIFYGLDPNDNGLNPNNNGLVGDPAQGASGDPDSDNLTNLEEFNLETSPVSDDTDMDGLTDDVEDGGGIWVSASQTGTNPLIDDTDEDGLLDGDEDPTLPFVDANQPGTDPNEADSDDDGLEDGLELDLGRDPTIDDPLNPVPGLVADFDGNGEGFEDAALRLARKGQWIPANGTSDGNYYQLLENIGSAGNFISFESAQDYTGWQNFSFQMDYLAQNVQADGFGVNFLSTTVHGDSGVVPLVFETVEERARIENSFGVGFRTFQATNSTITWNGVEIGGDSPYTLTQDVWASVGIDVTRDPVTNDASVDVTMYDQPDRQGNAQNVFTDFSIPAMDLEDFRVQIAGRTGGSAMNLAIDNVKLFVDQGPGQGAELEISSISTQVVPGDPDTISVTITWNSQDGTGYSILANDNLEDELSLWIELDDNYSAAPGQETTSFTESGLPADTVKRFYIVRIAQ
ncbi:MAG: hypothetical protein PVJ98_03310 [Akkermansiaceae bacterium]|jgi:hypothetical protein